MAHKNHIRSSRTSDVLLICTELGKRFCKNLRQSLWYGARDIMNEFNPFPTQIQLRKQEFWALEQVSFELKRGECLAIIGSNGSGKSTLLKILNGLLKPDLGSVEIWGKVGAMIELSAGFNPVLTGRENIYLYGGILGFSRKEIKDKYDQIVEFSELHEFMEMPVQNYSSGMRVRLGFSVAIMMEPDILLIDEVLAVGDVSFQYKCYDILEKNLSNMAIVMISHNMNHIHRLADKVIVLEKGQVALQTADIQKAIGRYNNISSSNLKKTIERHIRLKSLHINESINDELEILPSSPVQFKASLISDHDLKDLQLDFNILSSSLFKLGSLNSMLFSIHTNEQLELSTSMETLNLSPGRYLVTLDIWQISERGRENLLSRYKAIKTLVVLGHAKQRQAPMHIPHTFEIQKSNETQN